MKLIILALVLIALAVFVVLALSAHTIKPEAFNTPSDIEQDFLEQEHFDACTEADCEYCYHMNANRNGLFV